MKKRAFPSGMFLSAMIWLSSCANIIAPSGGEKDTLAPRDTVSNPNNFSLFFAEEKVKIQFTEFISLDNPSKNVIISPELSPRPKFKVSGKNLIIDLSKCLLAPATTYSIQFGESIQDYTEGNRLKNYRYVFSTGSFIDSGIISGQVVLAETNRAAADVWVLAYPAIEPDTVVMDKKPLYLTKADKNGQYALQNVAFGEYKLFALIDKNGNYKYDGSDEMIAFLPNVVQCKDSVHAKKMLLFGESAPKAELLEVLNPEAGKYQFVFSRPIKTLYLETEAYSATDQSLVSPSKDTITYWTTTLQIPTLDFYYEVDKNDRDTVRIRSAKTDINSADSSKVSIQNFRKPMKQKTVAQSAPALIHFEKPLILRFNQPILSIDPSKISLKIDSVQSKNPLEFLAKNKEKTNWQVQLKLQENRFYEIVFMDSAIQDFRKNYSEKMDLRFSCPKKSDLSSIIVQYSLDSANYILQVLDQSGAAVFPDEIVSGKSEKKYDGLISGKYAVVLIKDDNNNGKWDNGNFKLGILPEKKLSSPNEIFLKAGWELNVKVGL